MTRRRMRRRAQQREPTEPQQAQIVLALHRAHLLGCSRPANHAQPTGIFGPSRRVLQHPRSRPIRLTMAGEKHLEQANLDAVVLLRELEAAKTEINRSFLSRCDAVLFQW